MATTPSPMDLIDNELRKRRRVEAELVDPPPPRPALSKEMQLAMIESLEDAQRGAIPKPPITRAGPGWAEMYDAWKDMRAAKLEHPPDTISLEHVRLFISPRFKLVSRMQWPAIRQVIRANALGLGRGTRLLGILVLYRTSKRKWRINFLGTMKKNEGTRFVFESRKIRVSRGGVRKTVDGTTSFSDKEGMVIDGKTVGRDGLLYGRVGFVIRKAVYNTDALAHVFSATVSLFLSDIMQGERPTTQALAWKNKIAVIQGRFEPISFEDMEFALFYTLETTEDPSDEVETRFSMPEAMYPRIGGAEPRVNDVAALARDKGMDTLRAKGVISDRKRPNRIRLGVLWPNKMFRWLIDSKDLTIEFTMSKDKTMRDLRRIFEDDPRPEPGVSAMMRNSKWGYTGSMYLPTLPRSESVPGLLLIPAPWFFYYVKRFPLKPLPFAKGLFSYSIVGITLMTVDDHHIRAHQPFEMIFLPDDLDDRSLEDLAMLQRKTIQEHATAPFVEEEVGEVLELL